MKEITRVSEEQELEILENHKIDDQNFYEADLNSPEQWKSQYTYVKKRRKSPEDYRKRIDKLLYRRDLKYKGFLSYRSLKIIGFLFLIFAQIFLIYNLVSKLVSDLPSWVGETANVLNTISLFALPMFLAANFCLIMANKKTIVKNLIFYSLMAILFYAAVVLVYYRYLNGYIGVFIEDPVQTAQVAEAVAYKFFGNVINYNVFVDLALFSLFFFFFFYKPKKINTPKKMIVFRSFSVVPVFIVIASAVLYAFYYLGRINLPIAVLAILPCRSIAIYAIFVIISILVKVRQKKFIDWGGTQEEYDKYLKTKRNSLEVSVIASIVVFVVCLIDFLLLITFPVVLLGGVGLNFYLAVIIPFLFLLSYNRQPKYKFIDTLIPVVFVIIVVLLYLEGVLFALKLL